MEADEKRRIAIVNKDKCKPKKCSLECKKNCPINKSEKQCVQVTNNSTISLISEALCVGCNICVKKCPYQAIKIINLPKDMTNEVTHRYSANSFKLHRLPQPRPGQVLGLVGTNGIGKSTALQILSGKVRPNLGNYKKSPDWPEIIKYFRGSDLQNYFTKILEDKLEAKIKPQYVDSIPKSVKGKVSDIVLAKDVKKISDQLYIDLDLAELKDRQVEQLSGGELQRFAIMITCLQKAQILMFDEPSSYLDVKQRLKVAKLIRNQCSQQADNYIIVVEHDLSVLDYLSDFICCLYGEQAVYGVVTQPMNVRDGINIFLAGFVPSENMRFREYELNFKVKSDIDLKDIKQDQQFKYQEMVKKQGDFELNIKAGQFRNSQIIVLLGENGTGKTTFIKILAGKDKEKQSEIPQLNISHKPQTIAPKFEGSVRELLQEKLKDYYMHPQFRSDVTIPMKLDDIIDNQVQELSGGELQRVAMILALGKPCDVYLIDEPSAYLDSEQRIICAKMLKRFILNTRRAAFIVEHDFIMATYLADLVIVYEGIPGKKCVANTPQDLVSGMNKFLSLLQVTFRRDPTNFRPRINKIDSQKDREQKQCGDFFSLQE